MHLWHTLNLCNHHLYLGAVISNLTAMLSLSMYPAVTMILQFVYYAFLISFSLCIYLCTCGQTTTIFDL